MKEADIAKPVYDYFTALGYQMYPEVCPPYASARHVDFVGVNKDNRVVAVELKRTLNRVVFEQVQETRLFSHLAYAAVAVRPKDDTIQYQLCICSGIGVLLIENDSVTELLPAIESGRTWDQMVNKLLDRLKRYETGYERAGKPNEKGVGIAQDVCASVHEYLLMHPRATWKEIYANVPSHYASSSSMCSAMRMWCKFTKPRGGAA